MIRRRMTVKRVDPWSVLKLGLVVNIAGAAILVVTGVVVWSVVRRLQLVERVCEQAQGLLGFESCAIDGVQIMRTGLMLAGLSVVVATGVMVFLAFLYNLIADLTGGIEVSMLDHSGQVRSAGGVEVSPALRTETGRGWSPTGTSRAAATTGAVDPQPTMASPRARPQVDLPVAASASDPRGPVMGQPVPAQPAPRRDEPVPAAPPEPKGPGVLERASAAAGAAGAAVKGAAERSGAAVKHAADKTSTKLSDAGRRATTTLADVTEAEAAERAERARASRQTLDQLSVPVVQRPSGGGGSRGGSDGRPGGGSDGSGQGSDDLPPRGDDGRFLSAGETSSSGSGRTDGVRRSGSDGSRSPQEAAAERQKARAAQRRSSSGRAGDSDGRSPARGDDEPELMFGNHPLASSDDK